MRVSKESECTTTRLGLCPAMGVMCKQMRNKISAQVDYETKM